MPSDLLQVPEATLEILVGVNDYAIGFRVSVNQTLTIQTEYIQHMFWHHQPARKQFMSIFL